MEYYYETYLNRASIIDKLDSFVSTEKKDQIKRRFGPNYRTKFTFLYLEESNDTEYDWVITGLISVPYSVGDNHTNMYPDIKYYQVKIKHNISPTKLIFDSSFLLYENWSTEKLVDEFILEDGYVSHNINGEQVEVFPGVTLSSPLDENVMPLKNQTAEPLKRKL